MTDKEVYDLSQTGDEVQNILDKGAALPTNPELQAALSGKQDVIPDLSTIRQNAQNGQVAYEQQATVVQQAAQAVEAATDAEHEAQLAQAAALAAEGKLEDLETFLQGLDPESAASVAAELGLFEQEVRENYAKKTECVFDISAYHATGTPPVLAIYADLTAALGTDGDNVPEALRKGGMSVKFVQGTEHTSDNNYVQFRYMGTATTGSPNPFLDTANWQGVDDNPAAGSDNLLKSGGIGGILASKGITELSFNIVGGINGNDGTDSNHAGYRRTGYIHVTQGMKLTYDLKAGSTGWATIACYDSNGDYMSNVSVKGQSSGVFTVPSGVAKIRCVSESSYANTYAKFPFIADNTLDYPNVTTSKITDKAVTYPKLGNDVNSYLNRLLDISFIGGVNYRDGSLSSNSGKRTTLYVKVLEGEKINYNLLGGSAGWAVIAAYNSSFEYIKSSSIAGNSDASIPSTGQYVVPSGVAYIILSGTNTYDNSASFDIFETNKVNQIVNEKISEFDGYLPFKNVGGVLADGSDSPNNSFVKTDLIEVSEGDIIAASVSNGTSWCSFACYDSQQNFISESSIIGTNAAQTINMTIPQGVSYIKIASAKTYTDRYAIKNKVIRENDLIEEEEPAKINTVSIMKYGNILQQRGCFAIQMDTTHFDDERQGCDSMLEVLREYGLMSMDYAINVRTLDRETPEHIKKMLRKQDEGCEFIYHNLINSPSDFSEDSTLTVEELKEGVCAEKLLMAQMGFSTFGVVANVGSLAARYKPTVDNIFFWSEYGSKAPAEAYENTKAQYLIDHRIIRTGFDIIDSQYTPELEQQIINYGKAWIDNICTNKSFGVMYCHPFGGSWDAYRLRETTLRPLAAYIAEKISNGELWYGRTTECLDYLCR